MFCCWFIGINSDRKRVPKVNITVRERALQVVRAIPLELVVEWEQQIRDGRACVPTYKNVYSTVCTSEKRRGA